jgi:hypothetical protein
VAEPKNSFLLLREVDKEDLQKCYDYVVMADLDKYPNYAPYFIGTWTGKGWALGECPDAPEGIALKTFRWPPMWPAVILEDGCLQKYTGLTSEKP